MQCVKKTVLVPYSACRCTSSSTASRTIRGSCPGAAGARVLEAHAGGKTARLDIDYHGVRAHFTTQNANTPGELIVVTLKDGPFRQLHGEWRFKRLRADACKVGFDLSYEFSSGVLDKVIGPVFNHIATTFIDAFVKRAEAVYGEPY
jgi:ribosome-associated toxin RatA of RatAB toxin-antitoxin module